MERTPVDRVLQEANNLIESGHTRVNIGGILVCWYCGYPDRTHDDECVLAHLDRAVRDYWKTPRFILGLSSRSDAYKKFVAENPDYKLGERLGSDELDVIEREVLRTNFEAGKRLVMHIEWLEAELERVQGEKSFRDSVRDMLTMMRQLGGDGVGQALYLYRKGGNQRPTGGDEWAARVQAMIDAIGKVWDGLGGDPSHKS